MAEQPGTLAAVSLSQAAISAQPDPPAPTAPPAPEPDAVRLARPRQAWASLLAAFAYVAWREAHGRDVQVEVLLALLTLPWAYAGLRQVGKGVDAIAAVVAQRRGAP